MPKPQRSAIFLGEGFEKCNFLPKTLQIVGETLRFHLFYAEPNEYESDRIRIHITAKVENHLSCPFRKSDNFLSQG